MGSKDPNSREHKRVITQDTTVLPVFRALDTVVDKSKRVLGILQDWDQEAPPSQSGQVSTRLDVTQARLQAELSDCDDVHYQKVSVPGPRPVDLILVFVESLVEREMLQKHMIEPLRQQGFSQGSDSNSALSLADHISHRLSVAGVSRVYTIQEVTHAVLTGNTALIIDGAPEVLIYDTQGWKERSVTEPIAEMSIIGPHDSFTENIEVNIGMIRRRIREAGLKVRILEVGEESHTQVAVLYLEDRARAEVVAELLERIQTIHTPNLLNATYIEEHTTGKRLTLFPLTRRTSRPDVIAGYIVEGRVAILTDTSPHALGIPAVIGDFFMAADDYYLPPVISLLLRTVRVIGALIVLFVPALYIAVAAYNPDVLPLDFIHSIAQNRAGIPMTVLLEVLFMETMMELLHEAGVRLPQKIGAIATVFGGLILGQAASAARVISNIMVIVVAMTAIGSFVIPSYEMSLALRVARWLLILGAALFGLYAIGILGFVLIIHLNSLNSFGTPYLAPFAPFVATDVQEDTLLRAPLWSKNKSFRSIAPEDTSSQQQ